MTNFKWSLCGLAIPAILLTTACAAGQGTTTAATAPVATTASASTPASESDVPRLAVVIAIDQLRADYLERFREHFGEGGFRRFLEHGAYMTEGRFRHAVTKTCAGHATIATGTNPSTNGMIANDWWNLAEGREEYCARDDGSPLVGIDGEGRSPKNLIGATVGDVLKLSNEGRSKVASVSGKDRAAITMGGHAADAVFWMEDTLFVTSRYYTGEMPEWARRFNASRRVTGYFDRTWDRVLPESAYDAQGKDDVPWERDEGGLGRAFPHRLDSLEDVPGEHYVDAFEHTPFQDEVVVAFVEELMEAEGLGTDDAPDFLAIGLSSTDRVGHTFGPDSHEMLDHMVRTDRLLAELFDMLDTRVGLENVVVVLTADHGVAPVPEFVEATMPGIPVGRLGPDEVREAADSAMVHHFGTPRPGASSNVPSWVEHQDGPYVYLDESLLDERGIDVETAETVVAAALDGVSGIKEVYMRSSLAVRRAKGDESPIVLSFHPERSGHVMYVTHPYVIEEDDPDGTTHGSPWSYDQAVPIAFYGPGVRPGVHHGEAHVIDIAPTLSRILRIDRPPAARGRVLTEALR